MSSVGSKEVPENRHLKLVQACASGKEDVVRQIVNESSWKSQSDLDALRHGLQRVASRGNVNLLRFLLENGAELDPRKETEVAAVFRAAENGHVAATSLLLHWPWTSADPPRSASVPVSRREARDRWGRTAIFPASVHGYIEVVKVLIGAGADVNAADKENRTVLLHLAAERLFKWNEDIVHLLLANGADVEVKDTAQRTPLMWAAATGKPDMVKLLLESKTKPDVEVGNNRGRTALHFAAESNQEAIVELLLQHHANPRTTSDGGWTALHNVADRGHTGIVSKLLDAGADVNAQLDGGMTALHYAALNGYTDIVKLLLTREDTELSLKDSSDRTPMLCAAERGHEEIVNLLAPANNGDRLPKNAKESSQSFKATIVDFGINENPRLQRRISSSMFDLLYGWDKDSDKPKVPSQIKNIKVKPSFRWIHIPANNLAWIDAMLTKAFVESGHREVEDFKALEKCFNQEHRGPTVHASFMRTYAHRIPPMTNARNPVEAYPETIQEETITAGASTPAIQVSPATPLKGSLATLPDKENTPKSDKKKSKGDRFEKKQAKKTGSQSPNPKANISKPGKQTDKTGTHILKPSSKFTQNGKIVLFMPFLHYEIDSSREKMSRAIKRTYMSNINDPTLTRPENPTPDDLLIEAYLRHDHRAPPGLHPRRTLDQFFYHGIDTSERDQDQVVWRYCDRMKLEPKIYMVDQLWMWILGKDLIITSFPQRWKQPSRDPINLLEGIIHDSNAKTREPLKSVWDLAMLITGRCSGIFDRHRLDDPNYQFVDMFESSIGHVTNRETKLFARFNKASGLAAKWLREHRRGRGGRRLLIGSASVDAEEEHNDPIFVDTLLNIGTETKLLAEIKDIRDELNIIRRVLQDQLNILPEFADKLREELHDKRSQEAAELRKRSKDQIKIIEVHIKDLARMDKQAELIYGSLTNLLDLKQKHANAFEARFARDQAALTARQGQTIMVFTIVTIIFLPMSFIAAFFAINIQEFPKQDGQQSLPIGYVSKYMFGIGFGISIPLVFLALAVDDVFGLMRRGIAWIANLFRLDHRKPTEIDEDAVWAKRYNGDPKYFDAEKSRHREERESRSSFNRDLSPLSDRTHLNYAQHTHIMWARNSYEGRPRRDSVTT